MKILVTGGAGFIGSHLVDLLLQGGHTVTVIDNYSTGRALNLAHVSNHTRLIIYEADVTDLKSITPLFEKVDWVFHLAALADIVPSIQKPVPYHHSNVSGTLSVLEASRAGGIKRFIYAASSSCYGIPDNYPTSETSEIRPMYPYALTKYVGETYTMHWAQVFGLPAISLRMFNVFGPRSRTSGTYGAVFGVFLAQKLAKKPFTIVGDGKQTRDFTYVTDAAEAFVEAAKSDISGEIMNIGSDGHYSINQLTDLIGGEKVFIPKRPGEPDCTFADTTKIRSLLNWRPKMSFESGVAAVLDQIEYWREAPVWEPESIATATSDWFTYLGQTKK